MSGAQRTSLEWARQIAHAYRNALRTVDPDRCAKLDALARKRGQRWIAPTSIPAAAAEHGLDSVLPPKLIEQTWGIPAATLYGWKSKGLLVDRGEPRAPRFLVRDVLEVQARRRTA
ncbi:hypothetical protein IU487_22310 [Nocardia puris]|uniref:hypothetical protein n=1 Tax=Nocardia puris TaxID=208602 RepID=UPI0018940106|nr:hypothetical protein [Nocardia puris]MBF6213754.1 hypothetical protein [Nocardia puris]